MFEKLGKFHIKKVLGQGAMGEVYLGEDPSIGREVAIKTILPSAAQGDEAKERFEREAKAAGALNHPNLVTIYEFGEDQGVLYIAMELVPGHDLQELLADQSLTQTEVLEVLGQVCDGLDYAHRQGVVHRDIKPSNIRVQRDGKKLRAKVMDFGVARVANSDMTATGMVMGTVSYMAPEYIRSGKPDPRSDLFAVGVILYEALSGRKPFNGDTTPTILYKIVNEAPEPIDLSILQGISPLVRSVLDKGLSKDPDTRYQTGEAFAKALRAVKDPTWQGAVPEATAVMQSGAAASPALIAPTAILPSGTAQRLPSQVPPTAGVAAGPVTPPALPPRPAPAPSSKSGSGALVALLVGGVVVLAILGGGGLMGWRWWQARQSQPAVAQEATSTELHAAAAASTPAPSPSITPEMKPALSDATGRTGAGVKTSQKPNAPFQPSVNPQAAPATSAPPPEAAPSGPFSPENLSNLSAAEHISLSNSTMSEATALASSNPTKALEGLRNAIAADSRNVRAYAWAMVIAYNNGRYGEMRTIYRRARRNGFSLSQLEAVNSQLKTVLDNESFNHRIPGGLEGNE
ncbi:MAG: serine/threonine protein kinase [Acidobacteriota bacterium]|nr:serine/threonine protein kinase [Acidobacteriota bacterium]